VLQRGAVAGPTWWGVQAWCKDAPRHVWRYYRQAGGAFGHLLLLRLRVRPGVSRASKAEDATAAHATRTAQRAESQLLSSIADPSRRVTSAARLSLSRS